jgi:hypothetical protein
MMTEAIPLGGLLRVEVEFVVEGVIVVDPFDAMLERFTTESWRMGKKTAGLTKRSFSHNTEVCFSGCRQGRLHTWRIKLLQVPIQTHSLPRLDL